MVRIYADRPGSGLRQFMTDLLIVAWVVFWIWAATLVYDTASKLAVPGQKIESAGESMAGGLSDASDKVTTSRRSATSWPPRSTRRPVPPKHSPTRAGPSRKRVHNLAIASWSWSSSCRWALSCSCWLPLRLRWIRRASYATALQRGRPGRDLLALRALTNQPLRRLTRVHPEPANAWRDGDESVVESLAAMELRSLGLNCP